MFYTVCSLILACIAAVAAFSCSRSYLKIAERADELERGFRMLKVVNDRVSLIDARVDRLTGRVYAQSRKGPSAAPAAAEEDTAGGSDRSYAGADQLDPDLAAELALQTAPSAAPGRR